MKKVVFLFISSHDQPVYSIMRSITREYFRKMQPVFQYEYYFIEHRPMEEDLVIEQDTMFVKGTEHYYGILDKTLKAFEYINKHINYDLVIRTNLSSFWNFFPLYDFLDNLYDQGIATGICDNICMSGTGIILSHDVCKKLCDVMVYDESMTDDVIIRRNLERFMQIQPMPFSTRHNFIYGSYNIIPEDVSDILYFRVKNEEDRMLHDVAAFKALADRLYHITHA